jgi:class 3 adenylate cyclase
MANCSSPGERDLRVVPELVVLNGVAAGTVFVLGDVPAVVGRSPEAHLQIGDPWISSMHAMFERRDDGVWVVDLESRNGVFLGEERVGEAHLPDGAVVRLGRTDVRFSVVHGTAPFVPVASEPSPPPREPPRQAPGDGTLSTHLPLVRERDADPRALALRTATVLRMAIDAAGLEEVPAAPERVRAALDAAARVAFSGGAVVARLAGVGVLAVFGLAGPAPEDALAALRAARAARAAVRSEGGLDLRAAVESGPMLAGNVGGPAAFELSALGEAAERAERLLAFAERGEIVAGPAAGAAAGLAPAGFVRFGDAEVQLYRDPDA